MCEKDAIFRLPSRKHTLLDRKIVVCSKPGKYKSSASTVSVISVCFSVAASPGAPPPRGTWVNTIFEDWVVARRPPLGLPQTGIFPKVAALFS